MAEIRKHNPTTSDIGEQVRSLMGETPLAPMGENIRPLRPGWAPDDDPDDERFDPFASDDEGEISNVIPFRVGGGPLIGLLPDGLDEWDDADDDDNPDSAA
ncbi:MAG: hypothetical protein FWD63_04780 [Propionibacteriaceae bacterium]|nr:hypothetical protein [Propionibacteriaceae bacterium]